MSTKMVNGLEVTLTAEEDAFIAAEEAARAEEELAIGWKGKRRDEYPSIADQLDDLWHALDTDTDLKLSDFYVKNKAVKDANPKSGIEDFVWPELVEPVVVVEPPVKGPIGAHAEPGDPDAPTPEPHPEYYEID